MMMLIIIIIIAFIKYLFVSGTVFLKKFNRVAHIQTEKPRFREIKLFA